MRKIKIVADSSASVLRREAVDFGSAAMKIIAGTARNMGITVEGMDN